MKIYTIIGGVNGAGKSSLTGALKAERNDLGTIVDVDKLVVSFGGKALEAGKAAIRKIDDCISRGVSFTQETTLSGIRTENTIRKAKERRVLCPALLCWTEQRRGEHGSAYRTAS